VDKLKLLINDNNFIDLKENAYNFGPMADPDAEDIVTLTYAIEPSNGNSYMKVYQNTGEFRVMDRKGLLSNSP
jgi:hypothetical protein